MDIRKINFNISLKLWNSKKNIQKGYIDSNNLVDQSIRLLSNELGKIHSTHTSRKYWEPIIGPWIREFSVLYTDRYSVYKALTSSEKKSIGSIHPTEWHVDYDYRNYWQNESTERFNLQFYSQLHYYLDHRVKIANFINIEKKDYSTYSLDKKNSKINISNSRILLSWARYLIKVSIKNTLRFFVYLMSLIYGNKLIIMASQSSNYNSILKIFIRSRGRIVPYIDLLKEFNHNVERNYFYNDVENSNKNNRDRLFDNCILNQFDNDVFLYLLIHQIPLVYLEYFSNISINKILKLHKAPFLIYMDGVQFFSEVFKVNIAYYLSKGSKIVIQQHAGLDPIMDFNNEVDHDLSIADTYLTWGWGSQDKNVLPYLSIRLSSSFKNYQNNSSVSILYVCRSLSSTQRGNFCDSLYDIELIRQGRILFVENLSQSIKDLLIIRRRPGDLYGDQANSADAFHKKSIKFASNKDKIYVLIADSKIVLFESFSTGFFECMTYNKPAIIFLNKGCQVGDNKLSNKFLAILLEMNAIFYNAKDLNMFLEKDIESWWEKDITQKSRNLIVSEFGNFSTNYIKEVSLALTEYSQA